MPGIATNFRPCLTVLEIHVTYRCNMSCANCCNLIDYAPSKEDMSLEWLGKMLADSARLNWRWGTLRLHGGEPRLHPQFEAVCDALVRYKAEVNPSVDLEVMTNGYGSLEVLNRAKALGFGVGNSHKSGGKFHNHVTFGASPLDLGEDFNLGCHEPSYCGMAYTPQGFYECSPAGAMHRVFGFPPVAMELADVTEEKLVAGYSVHCQHCGFARLLPTTECVPLSPSWAKALAAYNAKNSTVC